MILSTFIRQFLIASLVITGLTLISCGDDTAPEKSATSDTAKSNGNVGGGTPLPSGRFQLPTKNMPVPDLWISLPEAYSIKAVPDTGRDEFYMYRSDDPSIVSEDSITPGFMRVYIGWREQSGLASGHDEGKNVKERKVMVGNFPATWKMWNDIAPDGSLYFIREITGTDFFAGISPELAKTPIPIHFYVAGRDSARVAQLMSAVETISLAP